MKNEKQFLLSFAIPTYNFGQFISETVQSIENGAEILAPSQFEIVILDGGSKDNTDEIVNALAEQYQNIRYIKQPYRGGIDSDINTVAEITQGKYIWLFSADDLLEKGWDRCIIPFLEEGGELFLVPAILCDIQMLPRRPNPIFRSCEKNNPLKFYISPENDSLYNYLNQAATLEAFFGFMGAVVVKADVWRMLPPRTDYFGSCWAHCVRLMPLLFRQTKITYLNKFLIKKRGGNDSFMENGLIARIAISVDGWDRIINDFFFEASVQKILYNILRKDISILFFIYAKISARNDSEFRQLNSMARLLFTKRCPSSMTNMKYLFYLLTPRIRWMNTLAESVLPFLIRIRHKIKSAFL